jgi:hypothetical protein
MNHSLARIPAFDLCINVGKPLVLTLVVPYGILTLDGSLTGYMT